MIPRVIVSPRGNRPSGPRLIGSTVELCAPTRREITLIESWFARSSTLQHFNAEEPLPSTGSYAELLRNFRRIETRQQFVARMGEPYRIARGLPREARLLYFKNLRPVDLMFSIIGKEQRNLIGAIVLRVSILHRTGSIRTLIRDSKRNQHIGREAKQLLLAYGFVTLGLEKICSMVMGHNVANRNCNAACGLHIEGILRNHASLNGEREDLLCMAIFKDEWRKREYDSS